MSIRSLYTHHYLIDICGKPSKGFYVPTAFKENEQYGPWAFQIQRFFEIEISRLEPSRSRDFEI